jgi:hypothetical protein
MYASKPTRVYRHAIQYIEALLYPHVYNQLQLIVALQALLEMLLKEVQFLLCGQELLRLLTAFDSSKKMQQI